uniref:Small nuclear RNA activating complex polypeptide 4 n=1 Tax=Suricata suricatta TaxID=37032 RepID=A0A673UU67_SURSU
MDVDAEREKIAKEIEELERILDPSSSSIGVEVSESGLALDSEADSLPDEDSDAAGSRVSEEERWGGASNGEDDPKEKILPEDPETCLQLNMVYQEVIQERLAEVSLLLAQNREQQEDIMCDLARSKGPRVKDGKSLPPNLYIGHFMKPYFKDRVTGVGPPANEDTREKAAQGIKAFEELLVTKWKTWEKALLRRSVVSDRLQRLLQPKLLKLEYLHQKWSRATSEVERELLEKQSREAEREVQDIRELPEEALLGDRLDSHDWEKISNVNFEGGRSAEEIRKFWQNSEHPSINQQEWSGPELGRLQALAAKHGHLCWQRVAEELGTNRSAFQCLQKFQQHNKGLKRREWTPEEDRLLTQLVQEMRVGSHIPYRRIYGFVCHLCFWCRTSTPGRPREGVLAPDTARVPAALRYLRRLHFGLKKGRWSAKEEEKLTELIEKYGAGHWTRIASELPQRTGSQCLSKWKAMVRKMQRRGRRRRRRPPRSVRWSSSSGDSSDGDSSSSSGSSSTRDSEDSEPEEAPEAPAAGQVLPLAQHTVPDMALWVPVRQGGAWGGPGRCAAPPSLPSGCDGAPRVAGPPASAPAQAVGQAPSPSGTCSSSASAIGRPGSAEPPPADSKGPADKVGPRPQCPRPDAVPLRVTEAGAGLGPWAPVRLGANALLSLTGTRRWRGHSLQRRLLARQLLMAVSPWVGDIALPCAPLRPAGAHTRADAIRKQLQDARLASTPVFTLFIRLFQIDTAGCMEVVRERKAQPPALLQAGARDPVPGLLPIPSRTRSPGSWSAPAREAAKQSASHKGSRGPQAPPPAPCGPRPKPKTVSELLREKRLREARAKRAALGAAALPTQLLLASPLLLQPHLPGAPRGPSASGLAVTASALSGPSAPAATEPPASGSRASAQDGRPSTLPALAGAPASRDSAPAASGVSVLGPSQVPVNCRQGGLGQSQAPVTSRKQGLPEAPPFLPAAPSPTQLPVQPVSPTPAVGTREGGAHVVAGASLPVAWVLTAQGLLPVPTVVGLPRPAGTSDPKGLSVVLPPSLPGTQMGQRPRLPGPSHPWQPLASRDTDSDPPSRTDPLGLPTPHQSQRSVQVDSDGAHGPGGLSCPGEAQVVGDTAVPAAPTQATLLDDHPEAKFPCPSQPSLRGGTGPGSGPGGKAESPSEPEGLREPPGLERPPPPRPGPERGALDLDLLSRESEAVVQEWLRGQCGVSVPPLGCRLPYQPPALCSLRALSALLLHKAALERRAACLVPGGTGAPHASLGQVRRRLRDSPAYLLLKARFLAAFTLPALLATLSPDGVPTTLSVAARTDSESEDDLGLGGSELADSCSTSGPRAGPAAATPIQGAPDPGEGSVPSCLDGSDHLDVLRTRHSWHARKRRRLL